MQLWWSFLQQMFMKQLDWLGQWSRMCLRVHEACSWCECAQPHLPLPLSIYVQFRRCDGSTPLFPIWPLSIISNWSQGHSCQLALSLKSLQKHDFSSPCPNCEDEYEEWILGNDGRMLLPFNRKDTSSTGNKALKKWNCIKLDAFYIVKRTVHRVKRQPTKWDKIVAKCTVQNNLIGYTKKFRTKHREN